MSTKEFLEFIHRRIIIELLDVLILGLLSKSRFPMSGYDVISFVHKKFGVLISSGTVYGLIYRIERQDLIHGFWKGRKRGYTLTERGKQVTKALLDERNGIINLIEKLLMKEFSADTSQQKDLSIIRDASISLPKQIDFCLC